MKKFTIHMKGAIAFHITLMLLVTPTYAQEAETHLKFKDIAITGSIENFVEQLKSKGYKLLVQTDATAAMTGDFANSNCTILISATKKTKQVYSVVVYDESDLWKSLKSDYLNFKKLLTQKYQVTPRSSETFSSPYYEGDGYELQASKLNKCLYYSIYEVPNGEIKLAILKKRISLLYSDSIGNLTNEREEKSDALNDL